MPFRENYPKLKSIVQSILRLIETHTKEIETLEQTVIP